MVAIEVPPVNDFPLEMFQLPGRLPETTLRIVGLVALIQDIAVRHPVCQHNYCGAWRFSLGALGNFWVGKAGWGTPPVPPAAISELFVFAHQVLASGRLQVS